MELSRSPLRNAGVTLIALMALVSTGRAQIVPAPPAITNYLTTNSQRQLTFTPYPAAAQYQIFSATNLNLSFTAATNGTLSGFQWVGPSNGSNAFFFLKVVPLSSNALLSSIVLNRLAYGPTPDDLENLATNGPQSYIDAQLAPDTIAETGTNENVAIATLGSKLAGPTNVLDYLVTTNNNVISVSSTNAGMSDFRAWFTLRAVVAKRQLLEILLQFFENHFVTQYSKSVSYLNSFYTDQGVMEDRIATQWEFLENDKWRNALLNPQCTFYDLLKISAESPAMIVYLDTVTSKGSGNKVANENYARELMELFTLGVNNGYDQNDVTVMSRCWTGWTVAKVAYTDAYNPFATPLSGFPSNNVGVWAFNYKLSSHNTSNKTIFPGKTVPARFGSPWAGRNYELDITGQSDTNGIQEGYQVIQHLANQPFAEEFISVKLCRLFVHDNFAIGYDFTDPNLSDEGKLVHQCMLAWENGNPKGQIRDVLSTIFNSDLFRGHAASNQKVKTPLEFLISSVRVFRSSTDGTRNPGTFTADTDGYSFSTPLSRMGSMLLFDRNDPNGYPEDGPSWISAGTLAERVRFVQSLCIAQGQSGHNGSQNGTGDDAANCVCSPVALLQLKQSHLNPPQSLLNATNVADYFLSVIYPGEGAANLDLYRTAAINYLNTDDSGNSSPFSSLTVSGTANSTYDNRVRGMVGLLLSFQRFQEQ